MAQHHHRAQRQPAAHGMHDDGTGKIIKGGTEGGLDPVLYAEVAVPHHTLEEGVDQRHQDEGGHKLRVELGALGDTTGDDRRDRRGEGEEEEELHQVVAVFLRQYRGGIEEARAIGHRITDKEVGDGGDSKVGNDLHQGVDLIFLAYRAYLKEGKTGMHRQHHNGAQQDLLLLFSS